MTTTRDLLFTILGAAVAAIGFALADGASLAAGFLAGAATSALVCWRTLRSRTDDLEAAELAARDLGLALLGAWGEELNLPPVARPAIAAVSTREEETPCSSTAT